MFWAYYYFEPSLPHLSYKKLMKVALDVICINLIASNAYNYYCSPIYNYFKYLKLYNIFFDLSYCFYYTLTRTSSVRLLMFNTEASSTDDLFLGISYIAFIDEKMTLTRTQCN